MSAYRVKPAVFYMFLAICIGVYPWMAYTAVQVSRRGLRWEVGPLWEGQPGQVSPESLAPPFPRPAWKKVTPQVALRPSLRQVLSLTSPKPSCCPQHFDLLYKTVQRVLPKAKML